MAAPAATPEEQRANVVAVVSTAILIAVILLIKYAAYHSITTTEANTLRSGGFRMVVEQTMTTEDCYRQCHEDGDCVSWTLVNNNFQRPEMICYLQEKPVEPTKNDCCTSGEVIRGFRSFF